MIKQIKFKTNSKSLCYYIPNADIESGAYRSGFLAAFRKYRPMDEYRVNEFQSLGLIVTLPGETSELVPNYPVIETGQHKKDMKAKEVFALCQDEE